MSAGDIMYTSDDRVLVSQREDSADWVLQFKFVRERNEGIHECQVGAVFSVRWSYFACFRSLCLMDRSSPAVFIWMLLLLRR